MKNENIKRIFYFDLRKNKNYVMVKSFLENSKEKPYHIIHSNYINTNDIKVKTRLAKFVFNKYSVRSINNILNGIFLLKEEYYLSGFSFKPYHSYQYSIITSDYKEVYNKENIINEFLKYNYDFIWYGNPCLFYNGNDNLFFSNYAVILYDPYTEHYKDEILDIIESKKDFVIGKIEKSEYTLENNNGEKEKEIFIIWDSLSVF